MTRSKRIALILSLTAACGIVSTATASAAPISATYCDTSLRGGGTLAPDNDVKREWNRVENLYGWDVYSSHVVAVQRFSDNEIALAYEFAHLNPSDYYYRSFRCWRGADGVYHDDAV